jgi:hypothetical protein
MVADAKILVGELQMVFWVTRGGVEATTDAEGRYLVKELKANTTYKVAAVEPGGLIALSEEFSAASGELRDGVDVRMTRGGGIQGRVTDEGGAPVAKAVVTVARPPFYGLTIPEGVGFGQKSVQTVETDADGRYSFGSLWQGDHKLTVDHQDFVLIDGETVKLRESEEIATFDVKLVRGGDVRGRVAALRRRAGRRRGSSCIHAVFRVGGGGGDGGRRRRLRPPASTPR